MTELNKLSIAIKKLQSELKEDRKYIIEVIGSNTDMYQNIYPLCMDVQVINQQRNQYNQPDYTTVSDAYLLDGLGPSFTKANYTIQPIVSEAGRIIEYKCEYTPYVDVNTFTTYLESQQILYF